MKGNVIRFLHPRYALFLLYFLLILPARGQFSVEFSPDSLTVNAGAVFQFRLTATETIPARSEIKLMTPAGLSNILWPVFSNIAASTSGPSSISVTAFMNAQLEMPPIWDDDTQPGVITFKLNNAPLEIGEWIDISLGNNNLDGAFLVRGLRTAGKVQFRLALVDRTTGAWREFGRPALVMLALPPVDIRIFAPSVVKTGDTASVKISVWDMFRNRSPRFQGSLQLTVEGVEAIIPASVQFTVSDTGYMEVPVIYSESGFNTIRAALSEVAYPVTGLPAGYTCRSNPTWIQDDPAYYIYWGDLHSHSGRSRDGQGSGSANYARYTSCLDFFSAAEHLNGAASVPDTFGINQEEWQGITQDVLHHHVPGRFIPVTAYETSYYAREGGHHVAYFEHADEDIGEVPFFPRKTFHTIFAFWEQLALLPPTIKALSWPHFTGEPFYANTGDPSWGLDELSINEESLPRLVGPEYISPFRPLFEMFSDHGQSEYYSPGHGLNKGPCFWFAQDALAMGEKVGFIASSDDHTARPGSPGMGSCAVLVPSLDRTSIFDAFRNRRTYATTSERLLIDFRINDTIMGGTVNIEDDNVPDIHYMVHATGPLKRAEIVKWDFLTGTYGDDFHPDFQVVRSFNGQGGQPHMEGSFIDMDFYGHSVYYLRVEADTLVGGMPVWAWSSPIWVNNLNIDSTVVAVYEEADPYQLTLFPVPVAEGGVLGIRMKADHTVQCTFTIYDALGRVEERFSARVGAQLNTISHMLSGLPKGNYWLEVRDDADRPIARKAFLIGP